MNPPPDPVNPPLTGNEVWKPARPYTLQRIAEHKAKRDHWADVSSQIDRGEIIDATDWSDDQHHSFIMSRAMSLSQEERDQWAAVHAMATACAQAEHIIEQGGSIEDIGIDVTNLSGAEFVALIRSMIRTRRG